MPLEIKVGAAVSQPGTIQYGRWDAFTHPTGLVEFLPVIIVQGLADGPCIWLTAGIHGTEHSGPWVLYELLTPDLIAQLRGTIVAIPALCPPGIRTDAYTPYIVEKNPNRLWPDGKPTPAAPNLEKRPPTPLEEAYARLFEEIKATAGYLIDYHNTWTGSISFAFRDRVLYRADGDAAANKAAAEALSARLEEALQAYGHTIVTEFPVEQYIENDLHRSTSGAALLLAGIPAFTVELGTGHMPDRAMVRAALAGTRNVLRWAGMLPGEREAIEGIQVVDAGFQARRTNALRMPEAGVALHQVEAGDMVKAGDPVAELRDIWGRPLPASPLRAQEDGFVMGRGYGIYYDAGQTVLFMAQRDEEPLVGPYPKKFFRKNDVK